MVRKDMGKGKGLLTIICGPMYSGKTTELIRLINRIKIANRECIVFKPKIDNRYTATKICTHDAKDGIDCVLIDKSMDIINYVTKNPEIQIIGIDEIQFLDEEIYEVVRYLIQEGYNIIASGLDMDFRGEPFGQMPRLLCVANAVQKISAVCNECGDDASYTQRIVDGKPASYNEPIIVVGATEKYEARCENCHIVQDMPRYVIEDGHVKVERM